MLSCPRIQSSSLFSSRTCSNVEVVISAWRAAAAKRAQRGSMELNVVKVCRGMRQLLHFCNDEEVRWLFNSFERDASRVPP